MPGPKIAIIGAGPAGLTLARLLQVHGIDCTIYEADTDRAVRSQGGTLDLRAEGGQRALREAGIYEEFRKRSRPEGEATKLLRYDGHVFWDHNQITERLRASDDPGKPEIDREVLREILLDSVEPQRIQWNHKVARVETDGEASGKTSIHFANGAIETGIDLLVGADGAWSKARRLVTDIAPFYSGVTVAELSALNVSQTNPWLLVLGRGVSGGIPVHWHLQPGALEAVEAIMVRKMRAWFYLVYVRGFK